MCCVIPPASPEATSAGADGVEQRRLAVIDMAHDRDHGRAGEQGVGAIVLALEADLDIGLADAPDLVAELFDRELRRVGVDRLGDGHDRAQSPSGASRPRRRARPCGLASSCTVIASGTTTSRTTGLSSSARIACSREALLALALTAQRREAAPALLADGAVEGLGEADLAAAPARLVAPRGAWRAGAARRGGGVSRAPLPPGRGRCRAGAAPCRASAAGGLRLGLLGLRKPACGILLRPLARIVLGLAAGILLCSSAARPRRARRRGVLAPRRAGGLPPPPAPAPGAPRAPRPRRHAHARPSRRSSACAGRPGSVAPWRFAARRPAAGGGAFGHGRGRRCGRRLRPGRRLRLWAPPPRHRPLGHASAYASCAPRRRRHGCGRGKSSAAPGRRRPSS